MKSRLLPTTNNWKIDATVPEKKSPTKSNTKLMIEERTDAKTKKNQNSERVARPLKVKYFSWKQMSIAKEGRIIPSGRCDA